MSGPWEKYKATSKAPSEGEGPWSKYAAPEPPPGDGGPISPEELVEKTQKSEERPWYALEAKNLVPGFVAGLEKIDSVTAAPIRKFVTEKISGEKLTKAPTGAQQAKMLGASDTTYKESFGVPSHWGGDISPADIYGVGLEIVQDPFVIGSMAKRGLQGVKAIATGASELKQTAKAAQSQVAKSGSEAATKSGAAISGGDLSVEQGGKLFEYKAPQSLEELKNYKAPVAQGEMLGKTRLKEIENTLPDLQTKPLNYHFDMMENPKAMKELKLKFENLPTEDAKRIAAYNKGIIDESSLKIQETVNKFGGSQPRAPGDAGNDLINSVKEKYSAEKKALGPMFEKIKATAQPLDPQASRELIGQIGENSKVGKLLAVDEKSGNIFLNKNTPRTGLSDQEHGVLSRVIDDLNGGMTFEEIQKTREFLRKSIDPSNPSASAEVGKARTLLLEKLEEMAGGLGDDVSQTFKSYAVNERARESVEKIIGGKIESIDAMYAANPEKVLGKIFANPNHAKVVSEYVGPEKMREMVASHIQAGIDKASDSAKGFSPEKFRVWLKNNKPFLDKNIDPQTSARLHALADYGYYGKRFLDEVNPSGTAAALKEMIEPGSFLQKVRQQGIVGAVTAEATTRANSLLNQRSAIKAVNESLSGVKKPINKVDPVGRLRAFQGGKALNTAAGAQSASASARAVTVGASQNVAEEKSLKGKEKWANDGYQRVLKHVSDPALRAKYERMKAQLFANEKAKRALIQASDAKPGSKQFESLMLKIDQALTESEN